MKKGIIALLAAGILLMPHVAKADGVTALDSLMMRFGTYSSWCTPEKVYLHIDRTCFTAGESIWFKAWVRDASEYTVLPRSKFVYAEVLDEKGEGIVRVKVKRGKNGFDGCVELPPNLETGNYTLRGYTLWQLNNSPEYLFNEQIRIVGEKGKKLKKAKTPPPDVEISFWPESGRYFSGHRSVMGFKVVDKLGMNVDFNGVLVENGGEMIMPVATRHDGMGAFAFMPKPGVTYSIEDARGKRHPLPAPAQDGACIQVRLHSGRYYIGAIGVGGGTASLLVRDNTELRPLAEINLDGKQGTLMVERKVFRSGINHLLIVDSRGRILAERLFFVPDLAAPKAEFSVKHFSPEVRELTTFGLDLTGPEGQALDGECSVSVVRGVLKDWQQTDGIVSYYNLSSELKGKINKPCWYFDPDVPEAERLAALDILMMIQGWRYYDLEKILDLKMGKFTIRYMREQVQEIRGHISRMFSKKMPKKFMFTFMVPKWNHVTAVKVDQGKSFLIDSLDFEEGTEFLINIGRSRLGAAYLPRWNGDVVAPPFLYTPAAGYAKDARIAAPMLGDAAADDTLQAAVVTADYGIDDVLTFGINYSSDLKMYKDMTLVEYLSMKKATFVYDGESMYNRNIRSMSSFGGVESEDGSDIGSFEQDESGKVALIVDEDEQAWWGYDMIRLADIRAISVSTQPDPARGGEGGVVAISLKPGGARRSSERNPSLLYFVPLGYQVPRYFTSPRYDKGETGPADKRNTVWWSPDVKVSGGHAEFSFCNSDLKDYPYIVRIEGLTADGKPFSVHKTVSPVN
ncbi:MAG: hypothetical protein J5632_00530 [Bacteroidales bacterium]|nr:hypothetical protein [Bacteroidales bacterium]